MLALGDSITQGYSVPTRGQRWLDLVRTNLQQGRGGFGFLPAQQDEQGDSPYTDPWTRSGGHFAAVGIGQHSDVLDGPHDWATLRIDADRLWISYIAQPGAGQISVTIDGQQPHTINANSPIPDAGAHWDSGPLRSASHTIVVSSVANDDGSYRPVALEGAMTFAHDYPNGVHIWEAGHAGYSTTHFLADTTWASALPTIRPDLVIIEFGACDQRYLTPADFETNLRQLITLIRTRSPRPPSIVLMSLYKPISVDARHWHEFSAAQHRVAESMGASLVDLEQRSASPGGGTDSLTVDGTHPNAAGSRFIADQVLAALRA